MAHDRVLGLDAVFVFPVLEYGVKDGVGVSMIGNHDVFFAAAGTEGGAAHVISVQFVDGFDTDLDFVGTNSRKWVKR